MPACKQQPYREMTARQRNQEALVGTGAGRAIRGAGKSEKPAPPPQRVVRPQADSHYKNPTEFNAGPQKAGNITSGVRRYKDRHDDDNVGKMLSDEYLMTHKEEPHKDTTKGPRSVLANNCGVLVEEPPFRTGAKITHPGEPMDAPYFEDQFPADPRDPAPPRGKRFLYRADAPNILRNPGDRDEQPEPVHFGRRTHAPEPAVNLLNLGHYSPAQLKEKPVPQRQWGPRTCEAPDLPERRRPMIRPIRGKAKEEHDIFNTGRWGKPEKPQPRGVANGACKPKPTEINIYGRGKQKEEPKPVRRHIDPNAESRYVKGSEVPRPAKRMEQGNHMNKESRQRVAPHRPARARGKFANNGEKSFNIFSYAE